MNKKRRYLPSVFLAWMPGVFVALSAIFMCEKFSLGCAIATLAIIMSAIIDYCLTEKSDILRENSEKVEKSAKNLAEK